MADQEAGPSGATVKISVLASGGILLDGREVSLNELDEALQEAKLQGATVQYFRENAAGPAPPEAESVIRLVAGNRMRIALSTKPDFSDATIVKPPAAAAPRVIEFPGIESTPGVCGGEPRIVRTRIPVWVLEQGRRLGLSEAGLLQAYPTLRADDLANAWNYVAARRNEIEAQISANEAA